MEVQKGLLSAPTIDDTVSQKHREKMIAMNEKAKRRAKNKMQKASRKANRG